MKMNKTGQVWIETVLYTLIGLALIGIVLAFAMPKINEAKDKSTVEQAINSMNELDEKIGAVSSVPGNKRFINFYLRTGELVFNSGGEEVINLTIYGLTKPYSQSGVEIKSGRLTIFSLEGQKESSVSLYLTYGKNITFDSSDDEKKFTPSSTAYTFSIESEAGGIINISETSA